MVPIYFLGTLFYNKLATFIDRETLEKTIDFINQNFKKLSGIELVTDDKVIANSSKIKSLISRKRLAKI